MGDAAGGEEEDGGEGGDAAQQTEEGGPQWGSRSVPPLLDVGDVEDAGRRPLGLAEHLRGQRTPLNTKSFVDSHPFRFDVVSSSKEDF